MGDRYDDIINLPHPTSRKHPRMSMAQRAAQFAPFAALTGYKDAINEANRITGSKIELAEEEQAILNMRLNYLKKCEAQKPYIRVIYFVPDLTKRGGSYRTIEGYCRRVDEDNQRIVLMDGMKINFDDIIRLEGEIFKFIQTRKSYTR